MFMFLITFELLALFFEPAPDISNNRFTITLQQDHSWIVKAKDSEKTWHFRPDFVVLTAEEDPVIAMRPAGIENVMYNVVTWKSSQLTASDVVKQEAIGKEVAGDGFDDRILKGNSDQRTANLFKAANNIRLSAIDHSVSGDRITFRFNDHDQFLLTATLSFSGPDSFPHLEFTLDIHEENFYSVGYVGTPSAAHEQITEIWQPLIWQEKRFPEESFLTLAFQCPLPTTLACTSESCVGVVADPAEFPFDPLPLLTNSRFGVSLRAENGRAQPMLFAPALGGVNSRMAAGTTFQFDMQLYVSDGNLTDAFEEIARDIYKFTNHRTNATATLNETLDNMLAYGMSEYSWFVDSLKGCAYSTDVPGAVKNVSSLDPLQMALLTGREEVYWKRAYPIMEFLLSREKFLFTLDSTQKVQNPSRKMNGPVAPVSELAALYEISGERSKALLDLAVQEYNNNRTRNLDVKEKGNTWQNSLALFRATRDSAYLERAINGADAYLERRVHQRSNDFETVEGGFFFWTGFTPDWIGLLQLFEVTGHQRFLDAAQSGARHYAMFCWFAPQIPDDSILVNEGNKAPLYWYLKSKGHLPMSIPEEVIPAWRVSEIGLTPESSGTCSGHRAIFMANYAPWMLRIASLKDDDFLHDIARSAIVGRYANFPGYHMNTARTTAYEKADYPLRPFKELSVNSFHFNHIWPHMSILVDYLLTDAYVKSKEKIKIPSSFIEGYAYLQSQFYGHAPGEFYGDKNIYPWMPPELLTTSSRQLNYVSFRGNNNTYLAFMNQSDEPVSAVVTLNRKVFKNFSAKGYQASIWKDNKGPTRSPHAFRDTFPIEVSPGSITAIRIEGLEPQAEFQRRFGHSDGSTTQGLLTLESVNAKGMLLDFGKGLRTFYVYLQSDDNTVREATLQYRLRGKKEHLRDNAYPFEFTVPVGDNLTRAKFTLRVTTKDGKTVSENIQLQVNN